MIGILAKLAKAAKLAQTAEAAIDVASQRLAPGEAVEEPDDPDPDLAPSNPGPADHLRELLPVKEVERIIGKRIRSLSLAATDDCLVCDYHCKDRADTVLGLHLATKSMHWDDFEREIDKKEIFADLGDEAFRGGRQIYVRAGESIFWIHTAGEVMVKMAVQAARIVVARLEHKAPVAGPEGK